MHTNPERPAQPSNRRSFLTAAGATGLLAAMALPRTAEAFTNLVVNLFTYTGGVVSNPKLAGAAGELILNVYLAVDQDGTMSDVLHPEVNCHLAVEQGGRQGNTVQFSGLVQAAKDSALVGVPFTVTGGAELSLSH